MVDSFFSVSKIEPTETMAVSVPGSPRSPDPRSREKAQTVEHLSRDYCFQKATLKINTSIEASKRYTDYTNLTREISPSGTTPGRRVPLFLSLSRPRGNAVEKMP